MLCDAHVHVGYYPKFGSKELCYYSPRRICGVLNRCGGGDFIVSSTCSQIASIKIGDIVREAREVKRIAGRKAHIFFWLSGHLYDEDRELKWLDAGLFEGVKVHECETPWMEERFADLCRILGRVEERGLPVQIHTGPTGVACPKNLKALANLFPRIRFDFAHCRPMDEMARVMDEYPNIWTDTAYMPPEELQGLPRFDWHGRLMFGTDLPVWQARESCSLTKRYRQYQVAFEATHIDGAAAFRNYLSMRDAK